MTTYLGNTIVGINRTRINTDLANQSKGMESGQISYYKNVYSDILKYAHSTFDLSKFTVVGSPAITSGGVANGFTNSNYLKTIQVNNVSTNSFQIMCRFIWNSSQGALFSSNAVGSTEYGIALIINAQKLGFFASSNGTGWDVFNLKTGTTTIESGVPYIVTIIFDGNQYICKLLNLNTNIETTEFIAESNSKVYAGNNYINIGGNSYWLPLDGSIDLKSFAVWADGVPVFNGNITGTDTYTINEEETQIPYTLSKTGSKIVDVAYRDRVQDLYSQTGEALYYTIDEQNQNFTLPMGEVYGMISNISEDSLNKSQITNCILEIPQNIKLELTDGVLKLKAGSKVYIPNGVNNFDTETISSDITVSLSTGTGTYRVFYRKGGNAAYANQSNVKSGPTPSSNIQGMYYDTTLNKISFYQNNTTGDGRLYTFPLAEITITNGVCTAINQIFNGLGYIGSTVFLLPNLKVLLCDGRNADGTLNNYESTIIKCAIFTVSGTNQNAYLVIDQEAGATTGGRGIGVGPKYETDVPNTSLGRFTYNRVDNYIYNTSQTTPIAKRAFIARISVLGGVITSFKANYPFRAVDYNDFYELKDNTVTLNDAQTITGIKTFTNSININRSDAFVGLEYNNTTIDYTNLLDNQHGARMISRDKNGQYFATVESITDPNGSLVNRLAARRNINGEDIVATLNLLISENGDTYATAPTYTVDYSDNSNKIVTTAYMANHWCTSTPTTSTTASKVRPAVVIENYINGTNGYRLYSDGYCEQWGVSGGTGNRTVNLLKSYNNTNYCLQLTTNDLEMSYANFDTDSENFTDSSFFIKPSVTNRLVAVYWCTKGYIS